MGILTRLDRRFDCAARGTTVGREALGGATTFMALSYIIFVQPGVLGAAGMDFGAVMAATCVSSAVATLLMGLLANYPIGLAPGMGHNFFFAFTLCGATAMGGFGLSWQQALAAVCTSGLIFLALSGIGFRSAVLNSVPGALKHGIVAGIGLFIALIGLRYGRLVVDHPSTLVSLGRLTHPVAALTLAGLLLTLALMAYRVRGAMLFGMLGTLGLALVTGQVTYGGIVGRPPSLAPTFLHLDFRGLFATPLPALASVLFMILFLDLFDTVGTLIGVAGRAGLLRDDGSLPHGERALMADAAGTVVGAALGTSTVTSYIESAAGVSAGARTGLASVVTAVLMLLALCFAPLARMVGGGVVVGENAFGAPVLAYPIIAPALIIVGAMMLPMVREIDWEDPTEALPAFLTVVGIPFSFSIADGMALGFAAYAAGKLVSGRWRECPTLVYITAPILIARYVFLA